MVQAERDARDGLAVFDHQIEAVLVVHDGAQAHDRHVDVVLRVAHLQLCHVLRGAFHARRAQLHLAQLVQCGGRRGRRVHRSAVAVVVVLLLVMVMNWRRQLLFLLLHPVALVAAVGRRLELVFHPRRLTIHYKLAGT